MSEYIVTGPKKALEPDIMKYNPYSNSMIKPILGLCMPPARMHTHMNDTASISSVSRLKKKKIYLPTLPIFRPKGQTNLLFFRPYNQYTIFSGVMS